MFLVLAKLLQSTELCKSAQGTAAVPSEQVVWLWLMLLLGLYKVQILQQP